MWIPPKIWKGEDCWILGGGWSVPYQFGVPEPIIEKLYHRTIPPESLGPYMSAIHTKHIIAINKSYLAGTWIDMMFFGDSGWYLTERENLAKWTGLRVSCHPRFAERPDKNPEDIKFLQRDSSKRVGISEKSGHVSWNQNSGGASIGLAYHLGVKRILLLGFDMNKSPKEAQHWHGGYKTSNPKTPVKTPFDRHLPGFGAIKLDADRLGIEILNVSETSDIPDFPKVSLKEVL